MNELLQNWMQYKEQISEYVYRGDEDKVTPHWKGRHKFTEDFSGLMEWIELGKPEALLSRK